MTQSRITQIIDALAVLLNSVVDHMVTSLAACGGLVSPETGVNHDEQDPQA
jgi:hypothetical protein